MARMPAVLLLAAVAAAAASTAAAVGAPDNVAGAPSFIRLGLADGELAATAAAVPADADDVAPASTRGSGQHPPHPSPPQQGSHHRDVVVFTVANSVPNDRRAGFCRMVESALHNRIKLEVLGVGVQWHGVGTKLQVLWDRLAGPDIGPDTVVVMVDAFDVMFVHPVDVLVRKFLALDVDVVAGGECSCFPQGLMGDAAAQACEKHPVGAVPYRYLNSGTLVARAGVLRDILHYIHTYGPDRWHSTVAGMHDQLVFIDLLADRRWRIAVDTTADLFQTFSTPHYPVSAPRSDGSGKVMARFAHYPPDAPQYRRCNPLHDVEVGSRAFYNAHRRYAIVNHLTGVQPSVVHFNGLSAAALNATRLAAGLVWYAQAGASAVGGTMQDSPLQPLSPWDLGDTAVLSKDGKMYTFRDLCYPVHPRFPWDIASDMPVNVFEWYNGVA